MNRSAAALRVAYAFLKQAESQLQVGKRVEKEHEDVYDLFEKYLKKHDIKMPLTREKFYEMIAKAHLEELKDYYDKLKKIDPHHKEAMDFTGISAIMTPDRKLTDSEIARVLRLSISAEHDAAHLYELVADSVTDKKVQDVMRDVANEEKVHVGEFEALLMKYDKDQEKSVAEGKKEIEEI
jgi:hypothetical protein